MQVFVRASTIFGFLFIWIHKEPVCHGTPCHGLVAPYGPQLCEGLCKICSRCLVSKYEAESLACFLDKKTQRHSQAQHQTRVIGSRTRGQRFVSASVKRFRIAPKRQGVFICTLAAKIVFIDESGRWSEEIEHKNIKECSAIAYEKSKVYVIDRGGVIKTAEITEEPYFFRRNLGVEGKRDYTYLSVDETYGVFYISYYRNKDPDSDPKMYIYRRKNKLRERKLVQHRVIKVQVHKQTRTVFYVKPNEELFQVKYEGTELRHFKTLRFAGCFQLYNTGDNIYYYGYDETNIVLHSIYPMKEKGVVYKLRQQKFRCTFFWRVHYTIGIIFFGKTSAYIIPKPGKKFDLRLFPDGRSLAPIDDGSYQHQSSVQ